MGVQNFISSCPPEFLSRLRKQTARLSGRFSGRPSVKSLFSVTVGGRGVILGMDIHLDEYFQGIYNISRLSEFGALYGDFEKNFDVDLARQPQGIGA